MTLHLNRKLFQMQALSLMLCVVTWHFVRRAKKSTVRRAHSHGAVTGPTRAVTRKVAFFFPQP